MINSRAVVAHTGQDSHAVSTLLGIIFHFGRNLQVGLLMTGYEIAYH